MNAVAHKLFALVGARADVVAAVDGASSEVAVTDWPSLIDMARYNGVTSYVHAGLSAEPQAAATERAVLGQLRERAFRCSFRNLALRGELVRLLRAFADEGIPVIPIKGPLLADRYYRQPALREFGDLDLLVREADRDRAWQLLLRLNYHSPYENRDLQHRYHVVFSNRDSEEIVELHWRIAGPQFGRYYQGDFLWDGARTIRYRGIEVLQPTIEANLLYLAIHAYKHDWARLQWLLDFPELMASREGVDFDALDRLAREQHAHRLLRATLQLVRHFFPDQPSAPAGHALTAPALGKAQIQRILRLLVRAASDAETMRNFYALRVALADTRADQVRLIMDSLKPSDRDHELLGLPAALRPLSIVLRPLRLAGRILLGRSREAERRQP